MYIRTTGVLELLLLLPSLFGAFFWNWWSQGEEEKKEKETVGPAATAAKKPPTWNTPSTTPRCHWKKKKKKRFVSAPKTLRHHSLGENLWVSETRIKSSEQWHNKNGWWMKIQILAAAWPRGETSRANAVKVANNRHDTFEQWWKLTQNKKLKKKKKRGRKYL